MKHLDNPQLNLGLGITALMNNSSGTIEEIAREALIGIACFLQNQGDESDCGGLNGAEGFAKAAGDEYAELLAFRKRFDDLDKKAKSKVKKKIKK